MIEYSPEQCLPHAGNMVLLDQIDHIDDESISAWLVVRDDGLFNSGSTVPAWVGIEYMAQTIAAFAGYHALKKNETVQLGFLLGTRKYHCDVASFSVGTKLEIYGYRLMQDDNGMGVFDCQISGPDILINAKVNVFQPKDVEMYLQDGE